MRRFIVGPPSMTTIRLDRALVEEPVGVLGPDVALGVAAGLVDEHAEAAGGVDLRRPPGSGGTMPIIRMYPPSGIALTPYSVSPRWRDQSVGPKPTMYWVTFTPNLLAGTMWPISCSAIETTRPIAKNGDAQRVEQPARHRCASSAIRVSR